MSWRDNFNDLPVWLKSILGLGALGASRSATKAAKNKWKNRSKEGRQGTLNRKTGKAKMNKIPWWKKWL